MPTVNLVLDKRRKLKGKMVNLSVRVCHKGSVLYLPFTKYTESQYDQVFVRKAMDDDSIAHRAAANQFKTKCEKIYADMSVFNPKRFRELAYSKDKDLPKTLILKDLFNYYIENYEGITLKTRHHFKLSINKLETFRSGITVQDITPEFLRHFDLEQQKTGLSRSTIDGIFRNLRRVINYFTLEKKLIPRTYDYPFGSVSKDNIGEMLGHSNSIVTEHYLASLDIEKTHEINVHIL